MTMQISEYPPRMPNLFRHSKAGLYYAKNTPGTRDVRCILSVWGSEISSA